MGGGDIKVRRTAATRLTKRVGRVVYYPGFLWPSHHLHSNRDDLSDSGACVLGPFRPRRRTTLDARDPAHRRCQPGCVPARHVVAGDSQSREPRDAVDAQRLDLRTAVEAWAPCGGQDDKGRPEFPYGWPADRGAFAPPPIRGATS